MPGSVNFADWTFSWSIPTLNGEGLVISFADFKGTRVLYRAGAPFVLVPYHGNSPTFKDGLSPNCGGLPFLALKPTAPCVTGGDLPPGSVAANDNQAVQVELVPADLTDPAKAVVWAKLQCGNYQYIHRWEFLADGNIHAEVGLGGRLLTTAGVGHIHNFYFRLDFDIATPGNNLAQRFEHQGNLPGQDKWIDIKLESKETVNPSRYTKWRVLNKTPKANGQQRSYELIPGSDGAPDGTYSTGDLWVVRYKSGAETGSNVACNDTVLTTSYATPAENVDGQDVVIWYCLRSHHFPRQLGEEKKVLPYHSIALHMESRDWVEDTIKNLYPTTPPSPI
jgi:primary-amine oxidase